jgi:hypothetical protein
MSDDFEKLKAEVLARIKRVQEGTGFISERERGILTTSEEIGEAAKLTEERVRALPPEAPGAKDYLEKEALQWAPVERIVGEVSITASHSFDLFTSVGSVTTVVVTGSAAVAYAVIPLPLNEREKVEAAEKAFRARTDLGQLLAEVRAEMARLRLDRERERVRTPTAILDEAEGAIRVPGVAGGGVTSPLLSLRNAIAQTIEELIRRRPEQKPVSGHREKILSIGRYCSKPGLPDGIFETLAAEEKVIHAKLSGGGKRATTTQAEAVSLFHDGARFLRALLLAVDEARLRAP